MLLQDFDYQLPEHLIAHVPADRRDASRLMVVDRSRQDVANRQFLDIVDLIPADSILVLNNAKVMKARVQAKRQSGGKVEVFFLRELDGNRWSFLLKPAKRIQIDEQLIVADDFLITVLERRDDVFVGTVQSSEPVMALLEKYGELPLPHYILDKGEHATDYQAERYQTVFSSEEGSVAAPTAGLHFTEDVLNRLRQKGVDIQFLTLHVGYGTFKPIVTEQIKDHRMHVEYFNIPISLSEAIQNKQGRSVFAVGTTVMRALESAWDGSQVRSGMQSTDCFIYPGFEFHVVDHMITNFHLPKSSLYVLVSAFGGTPLIHHAYQNAIQQAYRFYSFGDAMLII